MLSHYHRWLLCNSGRTEQLQQRLCDMKSLNYSCLSFLPVPAPSGRWFSNSAAVWNYPENIQDQVHQTVWGQEPDISISKVCKRFHYAHEPEKFSPSPSRGPAARLLPCLAGLSQVQIAHPGRRQLSCPNACMLVPRRPGFISSTQ